MTIVSIVIRMKENTFTSLDVSKLLTESVYYNYYIDYYIEIEQLK